MRYWLGITLFAVAAFLVYLGLRHRRRVLALVTREELAARHEAAAADPHSLAAMGEIARPLILALLVWTGAKTTAAFYMMGGPRHLSVLDLAGFLALLAGYGTLLTMQTRYRMLDAVAVQRARATSAEQGVDAGAVEVRAEPSNASGAPATEARPRFGDTTAREAA